MSDRTQDCVDGAVQQGAMLGHALLQAACVHGEAGGSRTGIARIDRPVSELADGFLGVSLKMSDYIGGVIA